MLKKTSALSILFATMLTACSSEPSSGDIKSALEKVMDETLQATKEMTGGMGGNELLAQFMVDILEVEKLGCNESSSGSGYDCDVKVVTSSKFAGQQTNASTVRLVESDDGWMVIQ